MRLLENLPDLPEGEGNFWTHSTDGEHAGKFFGAEHGYNPLRRAQLLPLSDDPDAIPDIDHETLMDMMFEPSHEVVFVDRQQPRNVAATRGLIGAAIAHRVRPDRSNKVMTVDELVVHPDLRRRGVASFMLGRLCSEYWGSTELTEMIIDTQTYSPQTWFLEQLVGAGFRHMSENGSPAVWLPGNTQYFGFDTDTDDPETVKEIIALMPEGWNGYFAFYQETDPQTQVFRDGKLIGVVKSIEDTALFDDNGSRTDNYSFFDAGGAELAKLEALGYHEALRALLNSYQLI